MIWLGEKSRLCDEVEHEDGGMDYYNQWAGGYFVKKKRRAVKRNGEECDCCLFFRTLIVGRIQGILIGIILTLLVGSI